MGRSLKVLLIKAPEIDFTEQKISYTEILAMDSPPIPLGVASLSAYLKQRSRHQVHLLDIFAEGFDIYKERGDRGIFFDILEDHIRNVMPDVIGISALQIINYKWVHYIANVAKRISPEIKVIIGGGYATVLPKRVMEDKNVDYVVLGEGEEVLHNMLDCNFDHGCLINFDGVGFRPDSSEILINGKSAFIRDVDSLPFCDWEGINLERYIRQHKDNFMSYITSRGCPFGCSFCSTYLSWGKKFRPFSSKRVLAEVDYLVKKYRIKNIEFRDDNLTLDKKRALEILNGFVEREYNLNWTHPNALAIVTLDEEMIDAVLKSGCRTLTIAIESGSDRVIKEIIHKPVTKDKVRDVCRIARSKGLKIETAFIVGFPGERRDEIEETKNFALELKCDWNQIAIATPFPGTEMYEICQKNNYFVHADSDLERYRYGFANIRTEEFDEQWIKEKAYSINIEVNFLKNHNFVDDPAYAVLLFKDRLSRYPKHLIGTLCLAYAYKKSGSDPLAVETVERAVKMVRDEPEIYEAYKKYFDSNNPIFECFLKLSGSTGTCY